MCVLHMELVLVFSVMKLYAYTCWNILSALLYLRKLVNYQWNTINIYNIYIMYWKDYPGTLITGRN